MEPIIAYKAFNQDWTCAPNGIAFQYTVGETYTHEGEVAICSSGFHACELPIDVLSYYNDVLNNKYASVELHGPVSKHSDDTKLAAASITIKAEMNLSEIINRSVEWIEKIAGIEETSGDYSKLAASGNYSKLAASGNSSICMGTYGSCAKVGQNGAIALCWRDYEGRPRVSVGYAGENGIKADTWYRVNDSGEFVEEES